MIKIIELKENGDQRGKLVVLENMDQVPFNIERLFYIYDTKDEVSRGNHANKNSQFCFVCIKGSVKIKATNGLQQELIELTNPTTMLYMEKMVWKEMFDFSDDAILLVLSDCKYDKFEYINDFDSYLEVLHHE